MIYIRSFLRIALIILGVSLGSGCCSYPSWEGLARAATLPVQLPGALLTLPGELNKNGHVNYLGTAVTVAVRNHDTEAVWRALIVPDGEDSQYSWRHDINGIDRSGHFPLYFAISDHDTDMILFLLMNGADKSVVDKAGHDANFYARDYIRAHPAQLIMADFLSRHFDVNRTVVGRSR